MRVHFRSKVLVSSLFAMFCLAGCGQTVGRSNVDIQPDQNPITAETPTPTPPVGTTPTPSATPTPPPGPTPVPTEYGDLLGAKTFAVVVNKTVAGIGEENGNHFAQIRTLNGISSPGAYYGIGYGNKGFLGFGLDYHAVPVSQFESLSFRTFQPTSNRPSAYNVYLNLIVDLNCDPLKPDYTVVLTPNLSGKKGVWNRYTIKKTDPMFRTPGGKGGMPDSERTSYPAPLTQLVHARPHACFVAADIFGVGMKRNQKLAPFQIVHGDSIYLQASSVRIDDIDLHMTNSSLSEDYE